MRPVRRGARPRRTRRGTVRAGNDAGGDAAALECRDLKEWIPGGRRARVRRRTRWSMDLRDAALGGTCDPVSRADRGETAASAPRQAGDADPATVPAQPGGGPPPPFFLSPPPHALLP